MSIGSIFGQGTVAEQAQRIKTSTDVVKLGDRLKNTPKEQRTGDITTAITVFQAKFSEQTSNVQIQMLETVGFTVKSLPDVYGNNTHDAFDFLANIQTDDAFLKEKARREMDTIANNHAHRAHRPSAATLFYEAMKKDGSEEAMKHVATFTGVHASGDPEFFAEQAVPILKASKTQAAKDGLKNLARQGLLKGQDNFVAFSDTPEEGASILGKRIRAQSGKKLSTADIEQTRDAFNALGEKADRAFAYAKDEIVQSLSLLLSDPALFDKVADETDIPDLYEILDDAGQAVGEEYGEKITETLGLHNARRDSIRAIENQISGAKDSLATWDEEPDDFGNDLEGDLGEDFTHDTPG